MLPVPEPSIYDRPLWYDVLHSPGSAREVAGLVKIVREYVPRLAGTSLTETRWLEPACGTGRYLRPLAALGARVVGVDLNPAMVEYAAGRVKRFRTRARIVKADIERMTPTELGIGSVRFDAAFCLHNSVRHLPTPAALTRHLASVAGVLAPDGVYLVGTDLLGGAEEFAGEDVFAARRGTLRIREYVQYFPQDRGKRRVERVASSFIVHHGRERTELHGAYDLQVLTPASWRKIIRAAGLKELAAVSAKGRRYEGERSLYAIRVLGKR